jgi:hypothetical protein
LDASFADLNEAKSKIYNNCIKWEIDGELQWITISFKFEPKIFDSHGNCVSKCVVTDWDDMEFEWVDS